MLWIIFFSADENSSEERAESQENRLGMLAEFLPKPVNRSYYLIGADVTPAPRPFAVTLEDRNIVHAPNPAPGNKPIVVGHQFSTVAIFPEKEEGNTPPWAIPLRVEHVPSCETGNSIASCQISELLTDPELPFHKFLTVNVVDSAYGVAAFLGEVGDFPNLVTIARSRGNRVFFHQPDAPQKLGPGRPKWFGERFDMHDSETWGEPNQVIGQPHVLRSGKAVSIKMEVWNNIIMRGKRGLPMHQHPFTLIRSQMLDEDGTPVFKRPLWLVVLGERRLEMSAFETWCCYQQRYDLEHFFRFGKNRLLLASYQTPVSEHEENWWEIASLAYFQLWTASPLAELIQYPWEQYAAPKKGLNSLGPSQVQRDFGRIICQIGGSLPPPKPRGKSPGRAQGDSPGRRERHPIVFKGRKKAA